MFPWQPSLGKPNLFVSTGCMALRPNAKARVFCLDWLRQQAVGRNAKALARHSAFRIWTAACHEIKIKPQWPMTVLLM